VGGQSRERAKEHRPPDRRRQAPLPTQCLAPRLTVAAETVIETSEDVEDYKAFEVNIIDDYDAHTAVERELVLRLASLLWRIRRATSIETDLLRIQAEILRDRNRVNEPAEQPDEAVPEDVYRIVKPFIRRVHECSGNIQDEEPFVHPANDEPVEMEASPAAVRDVTHSFLRLVNLDNWVFDRIGLYEARLWRQTVQTLLALEALRRKRYRFG
jgi:hypothetical protein